MESKHQTLQGLAFPLQPEAQRALQQLRQKAINYIQLVGAAPRPAPARTRPLLRMRRRARASRRPVHCGPRVPVGARCPPALPRPCLLQFDL